MMWMLRCFLSQVSSLLTLSVVKRNPVVNKIKNRNRWFDFPPYYKLDPPISKSDREIAEAWSLGKSIKEVRASQKNELKRRHQTQMKRYREWKERRRKGYPAAIATDKSKKTSSWASFRRYKEETSMIDSDTKSMLGSKVLNRTRVLLSRTGLDSIRPRNCFELIVGT